MFREIVGGEHSKFILNVAIIDTKNCRAAINRQNLFLYDLVHGF
jgi:hypothetical protein